MGVNEFKDMWNLADELAEKDAVEFDKHPFKRLIKYIKKEGKTCLKWCKISRAEYKDIRRDKYLNLLVPNRAKY